MNEYTDLRKNRRPIIQRAAKEEEYRKNKEARKTAEREIVEALFRILAPECMTKGYKSDFPRKEMNPYGDCHLCAQEH